MTLQNLIQELGQMLDSIFSICNSCCLPDITGKCLIGKNELDAPLKIAIVGITSAGKSTLLNSLVKRNIVPTGAETLTYNVNVLRHITRSPNGKECLRVHMKDGNIEEMPISSLSSLVDGRDSSTNYLRKNVDWVEAFVDYDYLKEIDLIDTPGLLSTKKTDSESTFDLFNDEVRCPDVFIYLVQRAIHDEDIKAAKNFQSSLGSNSKISGLNTIAALTHCDYLCKGDYSIDFHKLGKSLLEDNRERYVSYRACFSKAFTLAAIYAQTAYSITDTDFKIIKEIKESLYDEILDDLYGKNDFIEDDITFGRFIPSKTERIQFVNRIDFSALKYSVWWLSKNPEATYQNLKEQLIDISGVREMDRYVFSNFKRLAMYFKALKLVTNLRKSISKTASKYIDGNQHDGIEKIQVICRKFEIKLQTHFSFLSILIDFYNGSRYFSESEWEKIFNIIDECLKEDSDKDFLLKSEEYLNSLRKHYSLLSDIEAVESCDKLINQIKITI